MSRHPIQPIVTDYKGVRRFKGNTIVQFLLDNGGIDLNAIATLPVPQEDREQFAQLIGYSVCGFHELSYVSEAARDAVDAVDANLEANPVEAERDAAVARLEALHNDLRPIMADLFAICLQSTQIPSKDKQ